MEGSEDAIDKLVLRYGSADITPSEFEHFIVDLLRAGGSNLSGFRVAWHETIAGVDGDYVFDATVRFRHLGMEFLLVVEAKLHSNPIKRALVQVLHSKAMSVGAHKAVLISTAPFQSGAIHYAKTHGIALAYVTETRFTFETRSVSRHPVLSRQQASEIYGVPTFAAIYFGAGELANTTKIAVMNADSSKAVKEYIFGVTQES